MDAGDDADHVIAGGVGGTGNAVLEGGAGYDRLTLDLSGSTNGNVRLRWDFDRDGVFDTDIDAFRANLASGDPIRAYTAYRDNNYTTSWIDFSGFEAVDYVGGAFDDLFFGNADLQVLSARGGNGTDMLAVDWSGDGVDLVWDLTVDNETEKTLANGAVVQSIERLNLQTGSGADVISTTRGGGTIATGAGEDQVNILGSRFLSVGSFNAHLETVTTAVDAGDDADHVIAGGVGGTGNAVLEGGAGYDRLTLDLSGSTNGNVRLRWDFDRDGVFDTDIDAFRANLASGDPIRAYTAYRDNNYTTSWIDFSGFEAVDYVGGAFDDLFFGNADLQVLSARGGNGTDMLAVDWSGDGVDLVWDLTVDNETEKTLANGAVVQSIERLNLQTGSGADVISTTRGGGTIATGAGEDQVNILGSRFLSVGSFNAHLETVTTAVDAGDDADHVIAGGVGGTGNAVLEGGAGYDRLTLDLSGSTNGNVRLRWDFDRDGVFDTDIDAFRANLASGDPIRAYTAYRDNNYTTSWIDFSGFEAVDYVGGAFDDLFFGNADLQVLSARGGNGTDMLAVDWSGDGVDLVWDLTVDNETEKTLANGAVVQSIERLNLQTGSGADSLVLGSQSDHVETGSGNDVVTTGFGNDFVDAGAGNDKVTYAGVRADFTITTSDGVTTVIGATGTDTLVHVEEIIFDDQTISLAKNVAPSASVIDAGSVAENDGVVTIDLLGDAGAADSDGGTLGVTNVSVTDQNGTAVVFGLTGAALTIDPAQFAAALVSGESATLTVAYDVTDGQGGVTPNTGQLVVDGLDGPFAWYLDGDADGFGVDDPATNQTAYAARRAPRTWRATPTTTMPRSSPARRRSTTARTPRSLSSRPISNGATPMTICWRLPISSPMRSDRLSAFSLRARTPSRSRCGEIRPKEQRAAR